ncbi:hypothetical protein FKP32DRAFT_1278421 [Trametes sanguinea]|nr:hypothetical protein FKP32DRAFT_1278421 [Trametes sanguinea]
MNDLMSPTHLDTFGMGMTTLYLLRHHLIDCDCDIFHLLMPSFSRLPSSNVPSARSSCCGKRHDAMACLWSTVPRVNTYSSASRRHRRLCAALQRSSTCKSVVIAACNDSTQCGEMVQQRESECSSNQKSKSASTRKRMYVNVFVMYGRSPWSDSHQW